MDNIEFDTRISWTIGLTTKHGDVLTPSEVIAHTIVPTLAARGFDGFSVTENWGYWKGQPERSLTVSVCVDVGGHDFIDGDAAVNSHALSFTEDVARHLAALNQQECVLWTIDKIVGGLAPA